MGFEKGQIVRIKEDIYDYRRDDWVAHTGTEGVVVDVEPNGNPKISSLFMYS